MQNTELPENPRSSQILSLLSRAAELPAGERDVFLSRECGEDEVLRAAVYERLLEESRGIARKKLGGRPGPVTSAVQQALSGTAHDRRVELLGKVVGDYRLVAIVGVGGVGTVYLGERADRAYSAQVAIKVVANSQLSHEVQRRFAAERQILANLNHPYIGRLLDAGETFFDEPYLVMEYVHGEAMDRYCDNQRLTVLERLELFLKVCDAVQYAHRNLIVHRDLKPGNILVSKEGIPKLLDFGIAKLLDESAQAVLQDGLVAHTRVHDRLLTPEYASPEQIRGQPVTTTSDVYALGMILYELLTGVRPYTVNALNQLELERSICIQDPLKPSQMAAALSKDVTSTTPLVKDASLIPTARKTTFAKLEAQLKGDLDAIVMKALRKEPEHRYSSVEHFIEDIQRHLHEEPVEARQGTQWYYTQRFIKRHTLGVISATTALLALIAVAIILSIQATKLKEQRDIANQQRDKATQESERAETVSNFMLDVFTAADPFQSQDKQITAKELLDKAANKIETSLTDQPEVKARLLEAIGEAYLNQGQAAAAIQYLNQALTSFPRNPTVKQNLQLLRLLNRLAGAYINQGRLDEASRLLVEARNQNDGTKLTFTVEYLQTQTMSGTLESELNHPSAALQYYEEAFRTARELFGYNHPQTVAALMSIAQAMIWQSKYAASEPIVTEAINIYRSQLPDKHPDKLSAELTLAEVFYYLGKHDEAITLAKRVYSDQLTVFGDGNPQLINTYDVLSRIYTARGSLDLADYHARKGLQIALNTLGENNPTTAVMRSTLSNVLLHEKKYRETEQEATKSLHTLKAQSSPDYRYVASAEYLLGACLVAQHRAKEAEPILRENIARWKRTEAPTWRAARSESVLGIALWQLHRSKEAAEALGHANEVLSVKDNGAEIETITNARKRFENFQLCIAERREDGCELGL